MYYSKKELLNLGFSKVGNDNRISRFAHFYGIDGSILGSNVRIDDFSSIKGNLQIGNDIHIASFCLLSGVGGKIVIGNYCGLSSYCSVYTAIEDFIKPTLISPALNKKFSRIISGDVVFEEAIKAGASCIFFPNIKVGFGATFAVGSMVNRNIGEGAVVGPKSRICKIYGKRDLKEIERLKTKYENENL